MTKQTKLQKTQAERLFVHLRRKAMTHGEMEALGISTCPWKRLEEGRRLHLREGEKLVRGMRGDLVTWRIAKVKEVAEA